MCESWSRIVCVAMAVGRPFVNTLWRWILHLRMLSSPSRLQMLKQILFEKPQGAHAVDMTDNICDSLRSNVSVGMVYT